MFYLIKNTNVKYFYKLKKKQKLIKKKVLMCSK